MAKRLQRSRTEKMVAGVWGPGRVLRRRPDHNSINMGNRHFHGRSRGAGLPRPLDSRPVGAAWAAGAPLRFKRRPLRTGRCPGGQRPYLGAVFASGFCEDSRS